MAAFGSGGLDRLVYNLRGTIDYISKCMGMKDSLKICNKMTSKENVKYENEWE